MNIPGYRIEHELGHGGMSTVYLAVQESLHRRVALKVMAPALAADRSFGERFLREARTVAQLTHPNILAAYDIGAAGYSYYMAMEYVPGGDLKQRMRQGALPPEQALVILKQMAKALGYAHHKGFVHRDVKPENVLFREDGTAVLADFGIAKAVGSGTKMTGTGMTVGTAHYMSPEQAQGRRDLDGRSDLYSLGIVFYEMLTGQVPFDADNTIGIAMQHVQGDLPELPAALSRYQLLLDRLLAKNPVERYADAGALIAAIEELQAGGTLERTTPKTEILKSVADANRGGGSDQNSGNGFGSSGLKWGIGGALLALLLVGGMWLVQKSSQAVVPPGGTASMVTDSSRRETETAEQRRKNLADGQEVERLLQSGREDLAALRLASPAGNNALEKYEKVLRLEPGNRAAEQGIAAIVGKYLGLCDDAIARGKFDKARSYLDKAAAIRPAADGLSSARQKLAAAEQQAKAQQAKEQAETERQRRLAAEQQVRQQAEQERQIALARPRQVPRKAGLDQARQRLTNAERRARFEVLLIAGKEALKKDDAETALRKFQAALELFPSDAAAKLGLENAKAEVKWQVAKKKLLQPSEFGDSEQKFIAFAGAKIPESVSTHSKIYQFNRRIFDDLYSSTNLVAEKLNIRGLRPKNLVWTKEGTSKKIPLCPDSENLAAIAKFHEQLLYEGEYLLISMAKFSSANFIVFYEFIGDAEDIMSALETGSDVDITIYAYCIKSNTLVPEYINIKANTENKIFKSVIQNGVVNAVHQAAKTISIRR